LQLGDNFLSVYSCFTLRLPTPPCLSLISLWIGIARANNGKQFDSRYYENTTATSRATECLAQCRRKCIIWRRVVRNCRSKHESQVADMYFSIECLNPQTSWWISTSRLRIVKGQMISCTWWCQHHLQRLERHAYSEFAFKVRSVSVSSLSTSLIPSNDLFTYGRLQLWLRFCQETGRNSRRILAPLQNAWKSMPHLPPKAPRLQSRKKWHRTLWNPMRPNAGWMPRFVPLAVHPCDFYLESFPTRSLYKSKMLSKIELKDVEGISKPISRQARIKHQEKESITRG